MQIICICPDICAFSVLHNRHCADICTICQKCQFEVRKGWQVLLLQSEAEDMHCKQADSATLKYLLLEFSLNNLFMVKCMVFMHRWCCRDHANYYMSKLQFDKYALLSRKGFCWEYALLSQNGFHCKYAPFWVCLVQTFTQTFRIWLRFCADIWTKNRRLASLHQGSPVRYIDMTYRLSIYRHFWKISISISIRRFLKISISIKYRID